MASNTVEVQVKVVEDLSLFLKLNCFVFNCKYNNYKKEGDSNYCLLKKIEINSEGECVFKTCV